jgi:hypothetical protein
MRHPEQPVRNGSMFQYVCHTCADPFWSISGTLEIPICDTCKPYIMENTGLVDRQAFDYRVQQRYKQTVADLNQGNQYKVHRNLMFEKICKLKPNIALSMTTVNRVFVEEAKDLDDSLGALEVIKMAADAYVRSAAVYDAMQPIVDTSEHIYIHALNCGRMNVFLYETSPQGKKLIKGIEEACAACGIGPKDDTDETQEIPDEDMINRWYDLDGGAGHGDWIL